MTTAEANKPVVALVKAEEPRAQLARGLQIGNMADLSRFGDMLAKSGYFRDARDAAQACVKVQAGLELGIPPVQAMTGIHIVEGKPTLSASLIATLVKRSGRYNYRILKHDETECSIAFFEGKEQIGVSTFTYADAEKAGVTGNKTWSKYRRNMLFARAMSNGARWHCPDIFGGPIYTPEELGVEVDGEGEPVKTIVVEPAAPAPAKEYAPDARRKGRVVELMKTLGITQGTNAYIREINGGDFPQNDDETDALISELEARVEAKIEREARAAADAVDVPNG